MISLRGAAEFIKSHPDPARVRVTVQPQPNIGDAYGVDGIWGGGATVLTEYAQLGLRDDLLNVRYFIKPASAADPSPVYQDAKWKVYEMPNAFPRAWVVHQAVVESNTGAIFHRVNQPGTDLHRSVVAHGGVSPMTGADAFYGYLFQVEKIGD